MKMKLSFYDWCIQNDRRDLIEAWDNNLNVVNIYSVSQSSGKKFYFKVLEDCPSVLYRIADITSTKRCDPIKKFYNSLGYDIVSKYGMNAITTYWSTKNLTTPWDYDKHSGKFAWFKCIQRDYHEDYYTRIGSFTNGTRCPWCAGKSIHPLDSFAQYHINRLGNDFLEKYWCKDNVIDPWTIRPFTNDLQIHIQCQHIEYHQYWVEVSDFSTGIDCPFCNRKRLHPNDSLGVLYPNIVRLWSKKNQKSSFEYHPYSHEVVWIKCENEVHNDYLRRVADITYKKFDECPLCVKERKESSYQEKVRLFLEQTPYCVLHEYDCTIMPVNPNTKHKMPFDNELCNINGRNLIIETHGIQHYQLSGWHITQSKHNKRTPQEEFQYQQWKDRYKKDYALSLGYEYLVVPYYTIDDETYKTLISNKITEMELQYYKNA